MSIHPSRVLPAAVFLAITAGVTAQDALPPGVSRVASVEGVTEYRLANGLRAVILPDPSKRIITVNIVYQVGSRHEGYGETGMAHLIEHLMSIGSTRHPDAKKEQADRGAQRNASTSSDRTNYYEVFPATDENLEWALDLGSRSYVQRLHHPRVAGLADERRPQRVRDWREQSRRRARQRVFSTAFLWHNYGKSTIGTKTDIEGVPIERLQTFYRTYYRPDNAVLVVAGRFDERRAVELIASKFGRLTGLRLPPRPTPKSRSRRRARGDTAPDPEACTRGGGIGSGICRFIFTLRFC